MRNIMDKTLFRCEALKQDLAVLEKQNSESPDLPKVRAAVEASQKELKELLLLVFQVPYVRILLIKHVLAIRYHSFWPFNKFQARGSLPFLVSQDCWALERIYAEILGCYIQFNRSDSTYVHARRHSTCFNFCTN